MKDEDHMLEDFQKLRKKQRNHPAHTDTKQHQEPTVAPSMESDELDQEATPEEIRIGDYTPTQKVYLDRIED